MKFTTLFIAHVPDADPTKDSTIMETDLYKLHVKFVSTKKEAFFIVKELRDEVELHSIILCPGFSNEDVGEMSSLVDEKVGISVARGDGKSSEIAREAMEKVGWFEE
ncbi:MAG: hypothetical protein KGY75_09535 [Candidatus Cloacimonetes bacterium]|nr:hypothetical protein [Candidatus Cloacimonadota bacterium]